MWDGKKSCRLRFSGQKIPIWEFTVFGNPKCSGALRKNKRSAPRCLHLVQVDVFSFAMVIYEIICREVPFEEEADAFFGSGMIFDMGLSENRLNP